MQYNEFLKTKEYRYEPTGFECEPFNKNLFDFQRAIVKWALAKGKSALFLDTGLGKTLCQLSWAYEVSKHTGAKYLFLHHLQFRYKQKEKAKSLELM